MNKSFFDRPKKEKVKIITEAAKESNRMQREFMNKCKHCGGDIVVRNPSGYCDHLRYPENCWVCSSPAAAGEELFDEVGQWCMTELEMKNIKLWQVSGLVVLIRKIVKREREQLTQEWENNKR